MFLILVCEWVGGFLAENQGSKSTQVRALIFPHNMLLGPTVVQSVSEELSVFMFQTRNLCSQSELS